MYRTVVVLVCPTGEAWGVLVIVTNLTQTPPGCPGGGTKATTVQYISKKDMNLTLLKS